MEFPKFQRLDYEKFDTAINVKTILFLTLGDNPFAIIENLRKYIVRK